MQTLIVQIPFQGFYESKFSDILDSELEQWIENEAEYRQAEEGIPAEIRLDARELSDLVWRFTRFHYGFEEIARDYVEQWNAAASEEIGFPLGLTFESMSSPKYYNFETDRLFAYMPVRVARKLFVLSRKEGHARLKVRIRERFTSRDGFISHYDNDLDSWLGRPVTEWDHNELGTLLEAIVGEIDDWDMYYSLAEHGYFYFDKSIDWESLDAAIEEAREEKRAELAETDPDWEPPYRCALTPDMFRD